MENLKNKDEMETYVPESKKKTRIVKTSEYGDLNSKQLLSMCIWMKRQVEYKVFSSSHRLHMPVKKGQIYEIDYGENVGSEFSHRHYGVVLTDSSDNNPLVSICPLKTNHNGGNPSSDINLGIIPGLKEGRSTLAIVNQIRTVDKMRIFSTNLIKESINKNEISTCIDSGVNEVVLEDKQVNLIINAYFKLIRGLPIWHD